MFEGLNKEQKLAVEHDNGTLIILAGAGCGKTKVLTSRIARLVQKGISPYEILAVTFTNKAANEMKERLIPYLSEDKVKRMWVGTFHGIAGRILRQEISHYKSKNNVTYDNNFVIYDDSDTNTVIKNILKRLNMDDKLYPVKQVKSVISDAKNRMETAYDYATKARSYRDEQYSKIYIEYEKVLGQNNAVDFDDMLLMAVEILQNNPDILSKYHNRFKHILVDEFQDTNLAQFLFIKALYTNNEENFDENGRSLCTVGDIDQSIYSWRGADYTILLNMQKTFKNSTLIKLEQNYRSTSTVLMAANAIIENNFERLEKNLYSNLGKGEKIDYFEAESDIAEANFITQKVKELKKDYDLKQCCVLYRTNSQSRRLEEACMASNLPYKIVGGLKFYDRAEIKDIIAYLKFIYNPSDKQSLSRIINVPKRSIGETTFKKLSDISFNDGISIPEIIGNIDLYDEFNISTKTKLKKFIEEIEGYKNRFNELPLDEFIGYLVESSGYLREIKELDSNTAETKLDNIQELINVAKEFEPQDENDILGEFLSQVSLVSDIDSYDEGDNALTLMTMHSAKGLEYEVVFLSGLDEGLFPHTKSLNGRENERELEEERRLMYVGVTRAKERLFLTHAKRRMFFGNENYYNMSRFISEIPKELINNISYKTDITPSTSTFRDAVSSMKNRNFESRSESRIRTDERTGMIQSQTTFGKNFIAPKTFIKKKIKDETAQKQAQLDKIKKAEDDKLRLQKMFESVSNQRNSQNPSSNSQIFNEGDRVLHVKYGIGNVVKVEVYGSLVTYNVEFSRYGSVKYDNTNCGELKKLR